MMTALEELTRVFGDPGVASEIIESLFDGDYEIRAGTVEAIGRGYTEARLAKATLVNRSGKPDPRPCVIKFCPPVPANRRRESRQHTKALNESPPEFRERHLAEIAFPTVPCTGGAFVVGQSMVDGDPLATVELGQLAGVCDVVWTKILDEWASHTFDSKESTVAELLRCELGDCTEARSWLCDWAETHGLLVPALLQLPGEIAPLPNPWRILTEDLPAAQAKIDYLVGRTHGDLHGDNVLVPKYDEIVHSDEFRLIDLATYDSQGPLSRDPATLLVSLCSREIGESSEYTQDAFLAYLERDRRDRGLEGGMPSDVRSIIDALRESTREFAAQKNWEPVWHQQLKVSLLAQAMLHSAYTSGTPAAARWCSRLAGRLTRRLLGPVEAGPTMHFDAGKIVEAVHMTAMRTMDRSAQSGSVFVDRAGQRTRLRAALEDQVTSVIVVSGPSGIGKTALVREVFTDLGWGDPDEETSAVHWHDATPYGEVGVPTLIEDIEPPGSDQVAGPSALARLEIALDGLERPGGIRPVIVLDSAENLLKEGHLLRDSQLDLALDTVQGRWPSVAKVVFVTQHPPEATTGVVWTETACRINLEGLEPPDLREYFAELDPGMKYGLADLPEDDLRRIHGRLAGNPRLAELLHACLSSEPPALQVREVGSWLSGVPTSEVHESLVRLFVDRLTAEQQRVAEAVAALGIPVHTDTVIGVLEPYVPAAQIEPALRALVAARFVLERRDGCRYLRKNEINAIFRRLVRGDRWADKDEPPTQLDLALRAAEALRTMQKDDEDVRGIVDLDMHFARVDVFLRAGMYEEAHGLIHSMEYLVHRWGSGVELRTQREAVQGQLHDDREGEMMNLAALGDIYSYSGDLPSARTAYTDALTIAQEAQDREAIRRVYIGMGFMFWEHDDIAKAEERYGWALGLASEDDDDGGGDRAAALIGRADCRQRHGDYRGAVEDALAAFDAVCETEPGLASGAALRLARWHAELNQISDARMMLTRCADLILASPDPWAQAELRNSIADLDLYRGRYGEARSAAQQAVDVARDHRDPINLRRSLTTLALAHVHLGDLRAARKAIEESARYRVAGRETVELALRGIIAHRCELPGTARDLFQQLRDETSKRTDADQDDLAAWDFTGLARCYSVLLGDVEPTKALEAFGRARPESAEPTPGLDDRLRFMVETMADGDSKLEPVLSELARIRPGRAG